MKTAKKTITFALLVAFLSGLAWAEEKMLVEPAGLPAVSMPVAPAKPLVQMARPHTPERSTTRVRPASICRMLLASPCPTA